MRSVTIDGVEYPSIAQASVATGLSIDAVRYRCIYLVKDSKGKEAAREKHNAYSRARDALNGDRFKERRSRCYRKYSYTTRINSGVYRLTCTASGNSYIGSTKRLRSRELAHKCLLHNNKHTNRVLQSDYDQYGWDVFTFEVVERCSEDELLQRESDWIYRERPIGNTLDPVSGERLSWV